MDRLYTPWRNAYVTGTRVDRPGVPPELAGWQGIDTGCVFCNMLEAVRWAKAEGMPADDVERSAGIILSAEHCFICLNAFPYSSGHMMIVPYHHTASLAALPGAVASELILLAQRTEGWLRSCYKPDGLNFGLNLGQAAGAGIADHLHLHALPRWMGDGSFMMTVADTRILPEDLGTTWARLRTAALQATRNDLHTSLD